MSTMIPSKIPDALASYNLENRWHPQLMPGFPNGTPVAIPLLNMPDIRSNSGTKLGLSTSFARRVRTQILAADRFDGHAAH